MKRLWLLVTLLLWSAAVVAGGKSRTVVVIDGAKYYIHTIERGETLYSLARTYGVSQQVIISSNPSAAAGLRAGEKLKIPYTSKVEETPSARKLRKTFDTHIVAQGETLYAIARRYAIPIQTVIADNPTIDPISLHPGDQILIRRNERGGKSVTEVQMQWEQYRNDLNSVADAGVAYHLVEKGETFYSLSHRYTTTVEQLSALNGGLQPAELKAGAIIKVPGNGNTSETQPASVSGQRAAGGGQSQALAQPSDEMLYGVLPQQDTLASDALGASLPDGGVDFMPLDRAQTLRVALMLPIAVNGKPNSNYLEFYQGFLMGLDSVKRAGYSVRLDLFNTARSAETVSRIVEEDKAFRAANLIVGPVYEKPLEPVVRYAETRGIPVVTPLADIAQVQSDVLFQMAPVASHKYDKVRGLIDSCERITFIYTDKTDREFEAEMRALVDGREVRTHRYVYEHASVVERRGAGKSPSDLTPLLHNRDHNLFVIMADNELDVDRILAALASANTSIVSRGYTSPHFTVLGNARWNRYNNISREIFFKDHIVFLSTYHAKRDSETVCRFDSDYIRAFGALPTLYSYRGYDAAVIFCRAMFDEIQYDLEDRNYTPLQTTYRFGQEAGEANHVNQNWTRVNYNEDFSISIE